MNTREYPRHDERGFLFETSSGYPRFYPADQVINYAESFPIRKSGRFLES
jgi:hypothetical protein